MPETPVDNVDPPTATATSVPSLPRLSERSQSIREAEESVDTSIRDGSHSIQAPESAYPHVESDQADAMPNGSVHLPPSERSQPTFRQGRFSPPALASPQEVRVKDVYDAVMGLAPQAKVSHVYHVDRVAIANANLLSVESAIDFPNGFDPAEPSFILVDCYEESINLGIQMLDSQFGRFGGLVIVGLLCDSSPLHHDLAVRKVPEFLSSGADDVIPIPDDAAQILVTVQVSLVKAEAYRQKFTNLRSELQASKRQVQELFWNIAHEIIAEFPQMQPHLSEVRDRRLANMQFVRKLGKGSFGTVFQWEDQSKTRTGVVKVMCKSKIHTAAQALQIGAEISVLRRLNHQNVVKLRAAIHGRQNVYLLMEMAGTSNLFQLLRLEAQGFPWSSAQGVLEQIVAALDHCHDKQVAHCDLKTENVVMSDSGVAKLVDFGAVVDMADGPKELTFPLGTMPFLSPEMMRLAPAWDPKAHDVWSFGVTMVEVLCGNHSFVHLMGWTARNMMSKSALPRLAQDLKVFFGRNEEDSRANSIAAIAASCRDVPILFTRQLLSKMLEFIPEHRILAKDVLQRITDGPQGGVQEGAAARLED